MISNRKRKTEKAYEYGADNGFVGNDTGREAARCGDLPTEKTPCNVIMVPSLPWFPCPFIRYAPHRHETRDKTITLTI